MSNQKPSAVWYYFFGILTLCIGLSIGYNSLAGINEDATTGFSQVQAPGKQEIMLASRGTYYIFGATAPNYNQKVSMSVVGISEIQMTLCSKTTGAQVVLSSMTAPVQGLSEQPIRTFTIDTPGDYLFTTFYLAGRQGPDGVLSVGQNPMAHTLADIAVSIAAALCILGIGISILMAGYRRSQNSA